VWPLCHRHRLSGAQTKQFHKKKHRVRIVSLTLSSGILAWGEYVTLPGSRDYSNPETVRSLFSRFGGEKSNHPFPKNTTRVKRNVYCWNRKGRDRYFDLHFRSDIAFQSNVSHRECLMVSLSRCYFSLCNYVGYTGFIL